VSKHDESNRHWERWTIAGTSEEHRRLRLIEDAFDAFTVANLERLGLAEGWRCLEVGAGAGSIAAWMAGCAGAPNVVATELRPEFARRAEELGVSVLRHDITMDPPPGDGFDVIHARAVLEHLTSRDEVIGRLADWLAPGGWLLVEDITFVPAIATRPVLRRAEEALIELLARTVGTDLAWARSLPAPLERAGLTETAAELFAPVLRGGGSSFAAAIETTMVAAWPAMVAAGTVTAGELDELRAEYADPSLVDCSIFFVAGRGRRPATA
jgi:2-polyprenyl-3-methyl-5-hydroxy-6-metoxy-1,4-benzoquinol methylase